MNADQPKADAGENIVYLSPDMLPDGASLKPGDRLTFVVTGEPDGDKDVPGYFEAPQEAPEQDEDAKWADDFKAGMSPMMSEEKGP